MMETWSIQSRYAMARDTSRTPPRDTLRLYRRNLNDRLLHVGDPQRLRDRRERPTMVHAGPEPRQRREVFGYAVAHVTLEAIARMSGAEPGHEAIAHDLGDDGRGRDRQHQRVAVDDRLAVATGIDLVDAVDEHEFGPDRQGAHRARQRPERRSADIVTVDPRRRTERHRHLGTL